MSSQPTSRMKLEFKQHPPEPSGRHQISIRGDIGFIGYLTKENDSSEWTLAHYRAVELRQILAEMDRLSAPPSVTNPKILRNKDTGETQPWRGEAVIDRYELVDAPQQEGWRYRRNKRSRKTYRLDGQKVEVLRVTTGQWLPAPFGRDYVTSSGFEEITRECAEG